MNEAETRAEYIDPAMKVAGWGVFDGSLGQWIRNDREGHSGEAKLAPKSSNLFW